MAQGTFVSVVDDIKARLDIVETVSGYVTLQQAGRNFKALCPFHTEKTPSFVVSPERQSWRCFGACATGGDAFSFVMRSENLEFGDALRLLARKTGVELGPSSGERRDGLYTANAEAARFYQDALRSPQGERAREYLKQRGLSGEAAKRFQLGYSPPGDALKAHLARLDVSEDDALKAGLLRGNEEGGPTRDFFYNRIMFPIHDRQGRVIGFGARALGDAMPKYLNTPQTPVFNKSDTVYALHLASERMRSEGVGVVVEGYMDAIAAHEFGYANVVASMGTALTERQVSQLRSLASSFVLALDADAAGQEATLRSLESSWRIISRQQTPTGGAMIRRENVTLRVAPLPPGTDPDALIRSDREAWERVVEQATPLVEYLIQAMASRFDLGTGQGKSQAAEAVFPFIASTGNTFDQERYTRLLADALGVSREALLASVAPARRAPAARAGGQRRDAAAPGMSAGRLAVDSSRSLDDHTLALLLNRPELTEHAQDISPELFRHTEDRELFQRLRDGATVEQLEEGLDETLRERLAQLARKELEPTDRRQSDAAFQECLKRLKTRYWKEHQESIIASEDQGQPLPRHLEREIERINAAIRTLAG